tara:strand:+ start:152 stop:493 length:342 start_codon:yes stop_codon:yes gene_type:complete
MKKVKIDEIFKEYFYVLKFLDKSPNSSQRRIAKDLGVSLGKINYTLKALKNKGYIKLSNFKRNKKKINYIYILTPRGIMIKTELAYKFMKEKFREYEELKEEIDKYEKNENKR